MTAASRWFLLHGITGYRERQSIGGFVVVPVMSPELSSAERKARYGGMTLTELKQLRALEGENARLKRIVAQQVMDIDLLKEINSKNW